ncbi:MAG TPA: hypothetical protein VMW91_07095 [Desulfosporosinus sp.]|nr:hypothetical protein [Desulfosporosinus sp.]
MTRTGRSRLEHRQGWQDAGWPSVSVAMDGEKRPTAMTRTRTFEIRALAKDGQVSLQPWMARRDHRHGWQGAVMARRDLLTGTLKRAGCD